MKIDSNYLNKLNEAIDAGDDQLSSTQSAFIGLAHALSIGGCADNLVSTFQQIENSISDLKSQLAVIDDELEKAKSEGCHVILDDDGKFSLCS
jgi:hypothetical protein